MKQIPTPQIERPSWDGTFRREISDCEVRAVNVEERSIEVVASTDALDSHGDIVEQDWDLKRYKKNPVILWNHNRFESSGWSMGGAVRPEDLLPIGRAENVRVEDGKLIAKIIFASAEAHPLAERVFQLFREKVLRAVSVGFRPGKVTEELKNGRKVFRLSECELREISAVPIGSNAEAVAKSIDFELEHLAAMVTKEAQGAKEIENMSTPEEQKALEAEKVARGILEKEAEGLRDKVKTLEAELSAEKSLVAKLEGERDAAVKSLGETREKLSKGELDARQGRKFAPSEREELEGLAKEVGIDRVCKLLDARPDVAITSGVKIEGKSLGNGETPPEVTGGGAAESILKTVDERVSA